MPLTPQDTGDDLSAAPFRLPRAIVTDEEADALLADERTFGKAEAGPHGGLPTTMSFTFSPGEVPLMKLVWGGPPTYQHLVWIEHTTPTYLNKIRMCLRLADLDEWIERLEVIRDERNRAAGRV